MAPNIYTIIMAGGVGSRFWPQSREDKPKQFIDILGIGKSLMQMTWDRAAKFSAKENILILTNRVYEKLIAEHLPDVSQGNILTEPSRNNTGPCIAYAAFKLYQKDPEAIMIILPSDHLILKEDIYYQKIKAATTYLQKNEALLTLGIQPSRPDTGYGYIQYSNSHDEIKEVLSFKEKPDAATAEKYISEKNYLWNAGIFIWKAKDVIKAFEKYAPTLFQIFDKGNAYYNTDMEQSFIEENYPDSPNISIDYAIMEKAENVCTIPADIGWSDLGTWTSLWAVKEKDANNNAVINAEEAILSNTKNCIISTRKEKLVVVDNLDDYIVIDEKDVLLIYPKSKEQEIKGVTQRLKEIKANKHL